VALRLTQPLTEIIIIIIIIIINDRSIDNVQICDSYINIPSSQAYR
jgi:hypothetical protein